MTLCSLAEHTACLDLLPEKPIVLDVGCRGFEFCRQLLKLRPMARIIAMDPDPAIQDPVMQGVTFLGLALVNDDRGVSRYASYSTGEGNFLTGRAYYFDAKMLDVPCISILPLMERYKIKHWDLIKLDCEASEFPILENWPGPIATQISVEFHDFTNPSHWDDAYFRRLWDHLSDYRVIRHEGFCVGTGYGHWDSVLALK